MRAPLLSGVFVTLALLASGCPSVPTNGGGPRPALKATLAFLAAPRVSATDEGSLEVLEEGVGHLTTLQGLSAAVFSGPLVAAEGEDETLDAMDVLGSAASILVPPTFAAPGPELTDPERRALVLRTLEQRKLLPGRSATFSPKPVGGARLLVLGVDAEGRIPDGARQFAIRVLAGDTSPLKVVCAWRRPDPSTLQAVAEVGARLVLTSGAAASAERAPEGPLVLTTPEGTLRVVRVTEGSLKTYVYDPATLARSPEEEHPLP